MTNYLSSHRKSRTKEARSILNVTGPLNKKPSSISFDSQKSRQSPLLSLLAVTSLSDPTAHLKQYDWPQ